MLTADLVRATRRGEQLHVTGLAGKTRERALELAEIYVGLAQAHIGAAHHELKAAWSAVEVAPRDAKLALGLLKLIEDECELEAESEVEPRQLRSALFTEAAAARRRAGPEERFDRTTVLARVGAAHGLGAEQVERALYSDLKAEHRLLVAPKLSPEALLARYELGQLQAVLLRAVKVTADVHCATPAGYRDLFRKLKFRRLMFRLERLERGYRIDIDGPFSLFESVTKYGLQLALTLPALLAAESLELSAELRWGKERTPCRFALSHQSTHGAADASQPELPDEVQGVLDGFREGRDGWRAQPAEHIIDLPGVGLCIPDLLFTHRSGARVFLEVLGYWSRDAVWRRVELVQRGLPEKILFAASERLRVSEAVLDDHPSGALYVYKGSLSAKALVERLQRFRG